MAGSSGTRWLRSLGLVSLVLLIVSFASAETDKVIVKSSRRSDEATTVDVGPAVLQYDGYGGTYEVAGMHGWVVSCNNGERSCYMPHAGDSGRLVRHDKSEEIYDGENVKIRWASGTVSIYVLKETY
jgi:hypothetical protein